MGKVQHTVTGCVPVDRAALEAYLAIVQTNENVSHEEELREEAERGRVTAEGLRVEAENGRVSAEGLRTDAEGLRVTAEQSRVDAEGGRVTAEGLRVEAERSREQRSVIDHSRADEDHGAAVLATQRANEAAAAAEHQVDVKRGYGIKTVTQRVVATTNGGDNIIRVTTDDDRIFDFTVKNGKSSAGFFATSSDLSAAIPSPNVGDYAFVSKAGDGTFPAYIYVCTTAGTWSATEAEYDGDNVDLTPYATKDEVSQLGQQVIYDVTKNNPTAGPNNDGKFESLSALLSDANLSTLIPIAVRCGGMSIRFVQTSGNKYIQARCMAQNFTTDITQWQTSTNKIKSDSKDLAESGGISEHTDAAVIDAKEAFKQTGGKRIINIPVTTVGLYGNEKFYIDIPAGTSIKIKAVGLSNVASSTVLPMYYWSNGVKGSYGDVLETELVKKANNFDIEAISFFLDATVVISSGTIYIEIVTDGVLADTVATHIRATASSIKDVLAIESINNNADYTQNIEFVSSEVWTGDVSDTISVTTSSANNRRSKWYLNVEEGQQYVITAIANSTAPKVIQTDDDDKIIAIEPNNITNKTITISEGATRLYVNSNDNFDIKKILPICVKMNALDKGMQTYITKDLSDVTFKISASRWTGDVGSVISVADSSALQRTESYIEAKAGDVLNVTGSIPNYAADSVLYITDNSGVILYRSGKVLDNERIKCPVNAARVYINKTAGTSVSIVRIGQDVMFVEAEADIAELKDNVAELQSEVSVLLDTPVTVNYASGYSRWVGGIGETINTASSSMLKRSDDYIAVEEGEVYKLNGAIPSYAETAIVLLTNEAGLIKYTSGYSLNDEYVIIPSGATRMYFNSGVDSGGIPTLSVMKVNQITEDILDCKNDISSIKKELREIYAPSPQKPCDDSSEADFNAETITPSVLYSAFDALIDMAIAPKARDCFSGKYINQYEKVGIDASNTYDIKAYVLGKRDRFAWKAADKLYAWKDSSNNIVYIDSCSPRVGDTIYFDVNRTAASTTIASYDAATRKFTDSNNVEYIRSAADNVAADVIYIKGNIALTASTAAVYDKNDASLGNATVVDSTHISFNSKSYERCASFDYHTECKGTIFLWANEHGAQSDPYEGSIILYRMAKDLVSTGCRNNPYLRYLHDNLKIVMIPIANPYSMVKYAENKREGRNNYNNVNINRNYDTPGWAVETNPAKGNYAGDQNETQFIMNTCLVFDTDLAIDVHVLSYVTSGNAGRCHHEGHIPDVEANSAVGKVMESFGLAYSSYGDAHPEQTSWGGDWIYYNGMMGGLIEMNAGHYNSVGYDGKQHSSLIMEANYTLLLNTLRMWSIGSEFYWA